MESNLLNCELSGEITIFWSSEEAYEKSTDELTSIMFEINSAFPWQQERSGMGDLNEHEDSRSSRDFYRFELIPELDDEGTSWEEMQSYGKYLKKIADELAARKLPEVTKVSWSMKMGMEIGGESLASA